MFKGGLGNMMKQAQELQDKIQKMQDDLAGAEVEGQSGAGLVKLTMNGKHEVLNVSLDNSLMSEPKEIVEDLVAAAVNDAVQRIEAKKAEATGDLGIPIPPGFKMPF
ncbi:MAG: YbaB/EbfC family nucleoid-associated protein [Pseudomonadota bacterium]